MKLKHILTILVSSSILSLNSGCKKEDLVHEESLKKQINVSLNDGRLKFNNVSDLNRLIQIIDSQNDEDPTLIVKEQTGRHDFLSIKESLLIEQEKIDNYTVNFKTKIVNSNSNLPTKVRSFTSLLPKNNLNRINSQSIVITNDYSQTDPLAPVLMVDELLPDSYFASILNERLEVQVADMIYKVTPYGTFMIEEPKYDQMMYILDNKPYIEDADLSNDPFYMNRISDNLYDVAPGVTLLDTYEAATSNIDEVIQIQDFEVPYNSTYQYRPDTDSWIYDSLPTIRFGGKTWFGKLFENILGREEIYTDKFSSNRRVRVNFYKMSWVIYSAVGISVKMQKKNLIGWSRTDASELRMGWDGIEYYIGDLPSPPPAPSPMSPQRFTPVDLPKINKDYVEVNLLGHNFKFDKNKLFQQGIKELHAFLPNVLGLKPRSERDVNYAYKVWSDNAKTSISYILDRDEIVGYNTSSLSKVINWSVGFSVSWDFINTPELGYDPLKFNVKRASVFGMAKYDGNWKGARIVLENN